MSDDVIVECLVSHTISGDELPRFSSHRYKYGDYVKYKDDSGFIIGRIIKLDRVNLGDGRYEGYTIVVVANKSKNRYAHEFSFGGECVNQSSKISEIDAVTLGL